MSEQSSPMRSDEFLITRNGQPLMFIHALLGLTWAHEELVFQRPIEKIGANLALWQGDTLLTDEKVAVVKIVAHWKKITLRRLKRVQEERPSATLHDVVWMGDFNL